MARLILLALMLLLAAAAVLGLRACTEQAERPVAKANPQVADAIVGLPDGETLIAAKGSVGRGLIDWLDASEGSMASFEVGGREFVEGSATPTAEGAGRLPRLVMILRAYPDVHVTIVGHSGPSGDPAADKELSRARAQFVADELLAGGLEAARVSIRAAGSAEPLPADSPLRAGGASDNRVSLTLTRPKARF